MSTYLWRKPKNPEHHNAGRKQSPRGEFASTVTFWNFQLRGAIRNLKIAASRVIHHKECRHISVSDLEELQRLSDRHQRLLDELQDVQQQIAEWNVTKKWVD